MKIRTILSAVITLLLFSCSPKPQDFEYKFELNGQQYYFDVNSYRGTYVDYNKYMLYKLDNGKIQLVKGLQQDMCILHITDDKDNRALCPLLKQKEDIENNERYERVREALLRDICNPQLKRVANSDPTIVSSCHKYEQLWYKMLEVKKQVEDQKKQTKQLKALEE
jgi:hypothetical protein